MTFDDNALQGLIVDPSYPKASILMPTQGPRGSGQDSLRFEHLLKQVAGEVGALSERRQTEEIVESLRELAAKSGFWRSQREGLAVFATAGEQLAYRLPHEVEELALVGSDFYVVSLARLAATPRYAVLAVSRAGVRLLEGTRYVLNEVDLPDAPESLEEITQYYELERQLQFRQASTAGRGRQVAMFHGHGIGEGRDRELVLQYLRSVDQSVRRALNNSAVPLVVVGPADVAGLYTQISSYGALWDNHIETNPDPLDAEGLLAKAKGMLAPLFEEPERTAVARYAALAGTGKTSDRLEEILPAAAHGRVETLLVSSTAPQWGSFDRERGSVKRRSTRQLGDAELVNVAAVQTLRNGGHVQLASGEGLPDVAAVFRF